MMSFLATLLAIVMLATAPAAVAADANERLRDLHAQGEKARERERYEDGIAIYDRILEVVPDDRSALFWAATLRRWTRDSDGALRLYDRLLAVDPDHVDGLLARARIHLEREETDRALRDLEAAYALSPERDDLHELLARAHFTQGRPDLGEAHLGALYDGPELHVRIGEELARAGDDEAAVKHFRIAQELGSDDPSVLRRLAAEHRRKGEVADARRLYERLAETDAANSEDLFWLATLLRQTRHMERAETVYRRAIELEPEQVDSLLGLARVRAFFGDAREAEELSRASAAHSPDYLEARAILARSLRMQHRDAEALDAAESALAQDPKMEEAWREAWWALPNARPWGGLRLKYYDTEVLEGRGSPPPFPIRTRYHGWKVSEEAAYPIGDRTRLEGEAEQFRDALEQEDAGFTIYDVTGFTGIAGARHRIAEEWSIYGAVGGAAFESNTDDPIDTSNRLLARAELEWERLRDRVEARVGYRRDFLLARSLAGPFDFGLFGADRVYGGASKSLGDNWFARVAGGATRYSDDTTTSDGSARLEFASWGFDLGAFFTFEPYPSRFLRDDNTLDFIDRWSTGLDTEISIFEPFTLFGSTAYRDYSDGNHERENHVGVDWDVEPVKPLHFGVAWVDRDFRRVSSRYDSFDYTGILPYVRGEDWVTPWLHYDLVYTHLYLDEILRQPYHGGELRWIVEVFRQRMMAFGTEGRVEWNDLDELSQRYEVFARYFF